MPTATRAARARARAARCDTRSCAVIASIIWVSMRSTGLSVIIGSWKTIATFAPRSRRSRSSDAPTSSWPRKRIDPPTMRPGGPTRPRIEKPVTVLPEPDSPTSPSTSPRSTVKLAPSTARTAPWRVKNDVDRSVTASTGAGMQSPLEARVHHVAQPVAHQVDGDDGDQQGDAGIERDPVVAREHVAVAVGDQQAERWLGDRDAYAEERERRLE